MRVIDLPQRTPAWAAWRNRGVTGCLMSVDGAEPGTLLKLRLRPHVSIEFECWNEP